MPEASRGPWGGPVFVESSAQHEGIIDLGGLQGRDPPARDWMVQNCFLRGSVAMVSGDGGIGKSLLMQQLATSASIGRAWLGMATSHGSALYLACEDDKDELWRRQASINRQLGCDFADLGEQGMELWPRVGQSNALIEFERFTRKPLVTGLLNQIRDRCRRMGHKYVIIDTATHTFRGNQNDETQVVDYITELRKLAIQIQGVVILTKHPSMMGRSSGTGESGSVSWNNAVRSRLYLYRDKIGDLILKTMKSNYGPGDAKLRLKWERGCYELVEPELPRNYYGD